MQRPFFIGGILVYFARGLLPSSQNVQLTNSNLAGPTTLYTAVYSVVELGVDEEVDGINHIKTFDSLCIRI